MLSIVFGDTHLRRARRISILRTSAAVNSRKMDYDDYEFEGYDEEPHEWPRDKVIDDAKTVFLTELFEKNPETLYYERQIEVLYENRFFHWISAKALRELAQENAVNTELMHLEHNVPIRFYWSKKLKRYWKRRANKIKDLVQSFSTHGFGLLLGHTGEILFDQALPWGGFLPVDKNT